MPSIKRQEPPRQEVEFPTGSMLASSIPTTKLRESYIKLCVYGRNRSGKTTLAAQFKRPTLFISSEPDECGGAMSISNMEGIYLQRVSDKLLGQDRDGRWLEATDPSCVRRDSLKGSTKVVALANELTGKHPFATVVLDTATSLQDIILVELMGLPKVPEQLAWGIVPEGVYQQRSEKVREVIRPLLNLKNCNVIILCQEKDHNDTGEGRGKGKRRLMGSMQQDSFMAPSLGATTAGWLQDNCGYVMQVYEDEVMQEITVPTVDPTTGLAGVPMVQKVGTGKRQRHLRLQYHPNFAAGSRTNYDPNMPEFVTAPSPRELYEAMAKYIPSLKV